ncbi:MAG: bacterioferritin [Clostridiaceae bacterium]|jgi:bacterioferritin|nr:bacterioferritin [Clostridiaceae bacterium]
MKKSKYFQTKPDHPIIKVCKPNSYYASLLRDSFAGRDSEMTKICQYLYHHFLISDINKEIAGILYNIAKVEMKHMEILAQLILQLDGDPLFKGGEDSKSYWNGGCVYYGINIYDMLRKDLASEYKALKNYEEHLLIIQDECIKDVLKRIMEDENIHIELLNSIIKDYFR